MDDQTDLLRKILDTLTLMAEPQIAERDGRLRTALTGLIGKSKPKAKAVRLMDGTRSQSTICKEAGIDAGALSRLVKTLRESGLVENEERPLKLTISFPPHFEVETEKSRGR